MLWQRILRFMKQGYSPGHFYSSVPDPREIEAAGDAIFDRSLRDIPGVELNCEQQQSLLHELAQFYQNDLFPQHKTNEARYYFENDFFSYADAIFLQAIIRHLRPTRIIEVGSGFSSAVILDTNDRFFDRGIQCTFIEPNPQRLQTLLNKGDDSAATVLTTPVQNVASDAFQDLQRGDILFVDGSHVLKTGSDVNDLLFRVLPSLQHGVWVHFHDVFYPFEYPRKWVLQDLRCWNEAYALRAFLQFNSEFHIRLWNDYISIAHSETLRQLFPLAQRNTGGGLWIERGPKA